MDKYIKTAILISSLLSGFILGNGIRQEKNLGDGVGLGTLSVFNVLTLGTHNAIIPRVSTWDFSLGSNTATSSAPFSWDTGPNLLTISNLTITGTCTGCSAISSGLYSGLFMGEGSTAKTHITSLTYSPSSFNFSPTASSGLLTLDYINGPASRSLSNTWSALNTFSAGASFSPNIDVTGTSTLGGIGGIYVNSVGSGNGTIGFNSGEPNGGNYSAGVAGAGVLMQYTNSDSTFRLFNESSVVAGAGHGHTQVLAINPSGGASLSFGLEIGSYASASFFKGSAFPTTNCTGNDALQWSTTGLFNCSGDFEPKDAELDALAALDSTVGYLVETGAGAFSRRTLTGTSNQISITNGDGTVGNPVFSIPSLLSITTASLSSNFEVGGYASISGPFTQNVTSSNSFNGSIEPKTSGIGSLGTTALKWSQMVANKIMAVVKMIIPFGSAPAVNENGAIAIDDDGPGQFVIYASGSAQTLTGEHQIAVAIPSTSFNYFSSISLIDYLFRGMTVKRIQCRVVGGTSIAMNFEDGSNNNMDTLTCATTDTVDDGSIANATLTKAERLVLEKGTVTGAVNWWYITTTFIQTRE